MPLHYRPLSDLRTLETPALTHTLNVSELALKERAIAAFYGDAGCGKSYAVDVALEVALKLGNAAQAHVLDLPNSPSPKDIVCALGEAVLGIDGESYTARALTRLLIDALGTEEPRIIVVEEAQRYTLLGFESLRHLYDKAGGGKGESGRGFALFFVGGHGCYERLRSYPMLDSRTSYWTEFSPLTDEQAVALLPGYHPLLAETEPEVLLLVQDAYAHGYLRNWADFLFKAARLCEETGLDRVSEEVARNVFAIKSNAGLPPPPKRRKSRMRASRGVRGS